MSAESRNFGEISAYIARAKIFPLVDHDSLIAENNDAKNSHILQCYGIACDSSQGYMMVSEYAPHDICDSVRPMVSGPEYTDHMKRPNTEELCNIFGTWANELPHTGWLKGDKADSEIARQFLFAGALYNSRSLTQYITRAFVRLIL
ncbi:5416_t:CDS:2 [Ambispora leptoticha]|uniref:5416_t:CDS:1 n=1 Tax=Ambispora leptoticha TaxID=144679 RepID=A0A9N8WM70_9GLOM|nr:5416_t:CDS:2 [Ambispora leptoticha]